MNKDQLLEAGRALITQFCAANELALPEIQMVHSSDWPFNVCAYYRPTYIRMCLAKTSHIGDGFRRWSFPGYVSDRTPYGVLAHELGHHVDVTVSDRKRGYFGDYSIGLRCKIGEAAITSYCPNAAEWFAEMFRLFVTNPDLLRILRPKMYAELRGRFVPVETRQWADVLAHAPPRFMEMARKKVAAAA
jgi:hypothetical protein